MGMITFRRYRMRLAQQAANEDQEGLQRAHTAAAEERTGTPLPEDFPGLAKLLEARPTPYRYYEDLYEADRAELTEIDGIGPKTADAIIDAYTTWNAAQG